MQATRQAGTEFKVVRQGVAAAAGLHGPRNLKHDAAGSCIRVLSSEAVLEKALLDNNCDPNADCINASASRPSASALLGYAI